MSKAVFSLVDVTIFGVDDESIIHAEYHLFWSIFILVEQEVYAGHYMTLNAIVCRENTVGIALYAPEADLYKISKSSMYFLHNSIDGNVMDE